MPAELPEGFTGTKSESEPVKKESDVTFSITLVLLVAIICATIAFCVWSATN